MLALSKRHWLRTTPWPTAKVWMVTFVPGYGSVFTILVSVEVIVTNGFATVIS